jgi:predicted Zn-dependent peptidase
MSNPYTLHTLDNGLRIVIERMENVRSAAAGFLARTGARDETPEKAGVSHFLEHMCFKGTHKRDWQEVSVVFDELGSIYNAFTSEDRTFYYGWVPKGSIEQQIELLADMMRPSLPDEEFKTEKNVILEEIAMSKDSIDHVAFDFLLERVFEGHPLSWPILGYDSTVGDLTRDDLDAYRRRRYTPDHMMLVVAGNVDPGEIIGMANRLCGGWESSGQEFEREVPAVRSGVASRVVDRFTQQLVALCYPAPGGCDPLHETAEAAMSILGGSNSRFFWNIMQKGISSRAGAYRMDLADCGLTLLFGQTDPDSIEKLADAMRAEAKKICNEPVEEKEVQRVKNRRRTSLAVEGESPYHRLVQIMDDMDYRGEPRTVDERLAAVEAVSVASISEFFEKHPIDGDEFMVGVGPREWPVGA